MSSSLGVNQMCNASLLNISSIGSVNNLYHVLMKTRAYTSRNVDINFLSVVVRESINVNWEIIYFQSAITLEWSRIWVPNCSLPYQ